MTLRYSINFSHYSFFQLLKRKDYWSSHQIIDIPTFYIMGKTILNPIKLELHIAVHGPSKAAMLWVTTVKANIQPSLPAELWIHEKFGFMDHGATVPKIQKTIFAHKMLRTTLGKLGNLTI